MRQVHLTLGEFLFCVHERICAMEFSETKYGGQLAGIEILVLESCLKRAPSIGSKLCVFIWMCVCVSFGTMLQKLLMML